MFILKLFIILLLLVFPFGEVLRFDLGNNIIIKPLDALVGLCIVTWFFVRHKKKQSYHWPFFLFPLICLFSLLFNVFWLEQKQFLTSFLYLLRWVSYALIAVIVFQFDKKFKKKITAFLLVDGLILLTLGFVQYFFYNSLKNLYYLGWDEHMHRIFSTFFDPNFAGAFFVLFFFFVAGATHHLLKMKKGKLSIIFCLILLLTLLAIFLTYSRSALVMLIVGSVVFLTLIQQKKLVLILFASIIVFAVVMSPKFHDENMNLFRMSSTEGRIGNYSDALVIIKERPLFGVGFNTYRYAKHLYGIKSDWTRFPSHADAGVDNSFLFVLATTGVVGLAAYLWLWKTILQKAFFLYKKKLRIGSLIVISSSIALFVDALFINSLFFAPLMLWMWVLIGLMEDL